MEFKKKVQKRDGIIQDFDEAKLAKSILNSLSSGFPDDKKNQTNAEKITKQTIKKLDTYYAKNITPTTTDIQDIVEEELLNSKLEKAVKAFKEYKSKISFKAFKTLHGVRVDLPLSNNAVKVLAERYLLRNEEGRIIETPKRLFERVAKAIAKADAKYGKSAHSIEILEKEFLSMMSNLEFLPNSPTLMNAGTKLGQLSACFVLPVEDNLTSIFHTLENAMLIQQSGGGTGFSFSKLRPRGDFIQSTKGVSSGAVSFIEVYDKGTEVIKQGSKRRGANMAVLDVSHPDIYEFITIKSEKNALNNFNVSVAVNDIFMDAVLKNRDYEIVNPRTRKVMRKVNASQVFNLMIENAWQCGDPGIIFLDEINRYNPTPHLGRIETTNPCGEQPLLSYESCNLGSINLAKMFVNKKFSWEKLRKTVKLAVRFLDNVIDANVYTLPEIEQSTKNNRKIGLGIMGFAEALIKQEIRYDSDEGVAFAEKLMKFINDEAKKTSEELAKEKGNFPNFEKSIHAKKFKNLRNATLTTIAPTGTISILANCSSGIEPLFAISFIRNILGGLKLLDVNETFEETAKEREFYSKQLMMDIAQTGSLKNVKGIPNDIKKIFATSMDISPEWHVKMQAAFQKHTDNAVSKTVNLPNSATKEDIKNIYLLAHKLKCKGITAYRYGSKKEQVLTFVGDSCCV